MPKQPNAKKIQEEVAKVDTPTEPVKQEEEVINPSVNELMKQIEEMKETFAGQQALIMKLASEDARKNNGPQATTGGLIGTFEKYSLDPAKYPDPTKRLASEKKLQRFAFKTNYEITWEVSTTSYKSIDGINVKEPKFKLELLKVIFDEDSGEPTSGRYKLRGATFHEDPDAAIIIAREQGIEVDESNEEAFLNEMRYLRMRDWLLGCFYAPKNDQAKRNKRQMVVDGKLVEYFEINSTSKEKIPFDELQGRV